jgi:hypothetical protein
LKSIFWTAQRTRNQVSEKEPNVATDEVGVKRYE